MGIEDRTALSQNVGTEWDLELIFNGQLIDEFGLLESVDRKINKTLIETTPANNNGRPVRRVNFHGYSFSYTFVRQDDTFDDLVDALVNLYETQGAQYSLSGQETIINNGQASQWQYDGGVIEPEGLGNIKGADKVDSVTFVIHWSSRTKIRGGSNAPDLSSTSGL